MYVVSAFRRIISAKRLQVRENIVHIRIGVLSKLVDVRLALVVDGESNLRRRP